MRRLSALAGLALWALATHAPSAATPMFFRDDPLQVEPETQDASNAAPRDIDLIWDLAVNLATRPGDPATNVRARNVNTIDEVPDSSWFTNRILARPVSIEEATRGPLVGDGPAPGPWTVTHPKSAGFAPGFRIRDARGGVWFVSLDPAGFDESATAALSVANKLFWALGYWQVENHLVRFSAADLTLAPTAKLRVTSGKQRPMRQADLDAVLARAAREPDGRYRAIASRGLTGTILGGFEYYGTRPDDPNDVVPHEHRRELRALKVFGAWLNLVDMKAGNTLDTIVPRADGRKVVRHYLQDVGSTFGTGANGPREFDEGWEALIDKRLMLARLFTFGFYVRPWQTVAYDERPSIGRFEGDEFDPRSWSPRAPPAAVRQSRADDAFWAARRVMAFSDAMIRAVVHTGEYSDAQAEAHLADVLIKRRDAIGRAYLPALTPLADFRLDEAGLSFANVAETAHVAAAPAGGYRARWFRFDNATRTSTPVGAETRASEARLAAPADLTAAEGAYVRASVWAEDAAHPAWATPVDVYFERRAGAWRLVGVERLK